MAAAQEGNPHALRPRRQPRSAGVRPRAANRPDAAGVHDPGLLTGHHEPTPPSSKSSNRVCVLWWWINGRPHCRSLGVPVGGAADRAALAIGNALVGNPPNAAALEVALAGPTLTADAELACVLYGAPFDLATDRRPLIAGKTFTLQPGEVLHVGGTARGVRAYLCIRGGLQTPTVLGSRSSLEPLKAGTVLPCHSGSHSSPHFSAL